VCAGRLCVVRDAVVARADKRATVPGDLVALAGGLTKWTDDVDARRDEPATGAGRLAGGAGELDASATVRLDLARRLAGCAGESGAVADRLAGDSGRLLECAGTLAGWSDRFLAVARPVRARLQWLERANEAPGGRGGGIFRESTPSLNPPEWRFCQAEPLSMWKSRGEWQCG